MNITEQTPSAELSLRGRIGKRLGGVGLLGAMVPTAQIAAEVVGDGAVVTPEIAIAYVLSSVAMFGGAALWSTGIESPRLTEPE